jgi:hypothetical protein
MPTSPMQAKTSSLDMHPRTRARWTISSNSAATSFERYRNKFNECEGVNAGLVFEVHADAGGEQLVLQLDGPPASQVSFREVCDDQGRHAGHGVGSQVVAEASARSSQVVAVAGGPAALR